MKIKSLLVVVLMVPFCVIQAQDFRMGKVSVSELEEKLHPLDTTAVASILYKKGVTNFILNPDGSFDIRTEVETRVKIYKKEGLDYANFSVPFYVSGQRESVVFNEASTYNLVNGKVERTKIKKEGEFTEQINEYYSRKKIVLPNVVEGSVIEYRYTFKSPYINTINDWYFQAEIPVNSATYQTYIPQYLSYRINLNSALITKTEETVQNVKGFNDLKTTYVVRDLPAIKSEEFVTNIKNFAANIKHELARTQFPNSLMQNFLVSWEDVIKSIYDNEQFGNELKQSSYFEEDLKNVIDPTMTPTDKMHAVLKFVQSKMNWNERYGYLCRDGVKKAYRSGSGNTAEINLMLTKMLQSIGLTANPVLVSTRDNGISIFPSKNSFDYVIACVELNNKKYLLDATSKYSMPDIIPARAINYTGRLIRENKTSEEIRLVPEKVSRRVISGMYSIDQNGEVTGKVRHQYLDYEAFNFRERYIDTSEESYLENFEKAYKGIEVADDYKRTNSKDTSKPLVEDFSINTTAFVDVIGDKLYFSPMLQYQRKSNPFTTETRNYPIDFVFPFQQRFNLNYTIPENFDVESIPQPIAMNLPDGLGLFRYTVEKNGKQIQVVVDLTLNQAVISETYYQHLKDFYKQVVDKQSEKIVLKRI